MDWRVIGQIAAVLGLLCWTDVAFAEDDCAASPDAAEPGQDVASFMPMT